MTPLYMSLAKPLSSACLIALVTAGASTGCGESKKSFAPGAMEAYEEASIGFSLQKPANVAATVAGQTVTFTAEGFTTVTVTLETTEQNSGTGSSESSGGGSYRRKLQVPRRELTCQSKEVGAFEEVVTSMCKSLKNTKDAQKNPHVTFEAPTITGPLADGSTYAADIEALKPGIETCWTETIAKNPAFPAGNARVGFTFDEKGAYSQGSGGYSFGLKYDHKLLTSCVELLIEGVKPVPNGGEVSIDWQMSFALY